MLTIAKLLRRIKPFFSKLADHLGRPAFAHFSQLVLAIVFSPAGWSIQRLARLPRGSTRRTKHGEFHWKGDWHEVGVIQAIALDTLRRLVHKGGGHCYFIIDETQTVKQARKMAGASKLCHHASGKYGTGHTMLKVFLWYRGVTVLWGSWLWVHRGSARKQKLDFAKLTELAALITHNAELPKNLKATVLFDAYCLCDEVADACGARGWHYIGMGKANRNLLIGGSRHWLDRYGRNVLKREGRWHRIGGLARSGIYRMAQRVGCMKKLGEVKVVFSRRRGQRKTAALVTDDRGAPMIQVVTDYLKRWAVELLIKDEKQHLGPGDYRVLRYRAVVRHLALVDIAYAGMTHLAIRDHHAQGSNKSKNVLRLASTGQLKARMRQVVWQEAVKDVITHSHEKTVIRRLEKLLAA